MGQIETERLTSVAVPMAIVSSQCLWATGWPGAAVAAPNVAERLSRAMKLDINAHTALACPQPICRVPGASISPAFCNIDSTAGMLSKGWWLSKLVFMHCKDLVRMKKAGRSCFYLQLMLTPSGNWLLLGPVEDLRDHLCCHLQPPNL